MATTMLEFIGFNSRWILFYTNIIVLLCSAEFNYTILYSAIFYLDHFINHTLKSIIKEHRPSGFANKSDGGNYSSNAHKYGMPSGHAETTFMSLAFLYNTVKCWPVLFIELCICLITLYQRFVFKKHTPLQLVVGAIIGTFIGCSSVFIYKKYYRDVLSIIIPNTKQSKTEESK